MLYGSGKIVSPVTSQRFFLQHLSGMQYSTRGFDFPPRKERFYKRSFNIATKRPGGNGETSGGQGPAAGLPPAAGPGRDGRLGGHWQVDNQSVKFNLILE